MTQPRTLEEEITLLRFLDRGPFWFAGDLVGLAHLVEAGPRPEETLEDFCRRLLRFAIADGLVRRALEDTE